MMSALLKKFTHHYREGGISGLTRKTLIFGLKKLWSRDQWVIYEKTLRKAIPSQSAALARRELGFDELVDFRYYKAVGFPDEIRRRIASGVSCHGFFEGDRLATIGWSSPGYLELDTDLRVPCPGSVGLYDFFTYSEFRSKGYYTNALAQLLATMCQAGYLKACIAVAPNNSPSIKGIERVGFRRALQVTRRRRLGITEIVEEEHVQGGS